MRQLKSVSHAGAGAGADAVLLVFTLGALREEAMPGMLRTAFEVRFLGN